MVCDDVRRIAYFFLDGQLGERKNVDFQGHLKACPTCDGRIVFHKRMRELIRRRLKPIVAPGTLRERIHAALGHPGA